MAKKGLGKGLGALLSTPAPTEEDGLGAITELKILEVEPNRNQPRKDFDEEKIDALAGSIGEHGVIQPIVVTKVAEHLYQIVAGERRWRAAKKAGLSTIPAVIRDYDEQTVTEIALIENLQREDLNPIEEAEGYQTLMNTYHLTQESISKRIGKSRSTIANSLRLLTLDDAFRELLIEGKITSGHARAILSLSDKRLQTVLTEKIISQGLNVRQSEALARQMQKEPTKQKQINNAYLIELERIEKTMSDHLGTKVKISHGEKKGKIEIEYYGNDDLERLMGLLDRY